MDIRSDSLKAPELEHDFLIGIDSDGAVFDTMELKQKECFIPRIIRDFNLQPISKYVREASEFLNLRSRWRGSNRFPGLLRTLDLVRDRAEVRRRHARLPDYEPLRKWIAEEPLLSNATLQAKVAASGDPFLQKTLAWSLAVNADVERMVKGIAPFPGVREFLEQAGRRADLIVISQTPSEALEREWREHGLDTRVRAICGQEQGTKAQHLRRAASGRYAADRVLLIGDAIGDLEAARETGFLFYPINPGFEEDSWRQLLDEGLERFFSGDFDGVYQRNLIERFEALLPETPPWRTDEGVC